MIKLEDIRQGMQLTGLEGPDVVEVLTAQMLEDIALEIEYKTASGDFRSSVLYRDDEKHLDRKTAESSWDFHGDPNSFKLGLEALRIHLAHLFDPYLALSNSSVEPLPHQIAAVYQEILPRLPLRYVLVDDPGRAAGRGRQYSPFY